MPKKISTRIVHKHDLEVNWLKATNFVPMQGELIIYDIEVDAAGNTLELPSNRVVPYTYERLKIGDGVKTVNSLPEICFYRNEINSIELISLDEIDRICGAVIQDASTSEVKF